MIDVTTEIPGEEENIPGFEVSDEALEIAGTNETMQYTLAACSGLSVCPG